VSSELTSGNHQRKSFVGQFQWLKGQNLLCCLLLLPSAQILYNFEKIQLQTDKLSSGTLPVDFQGFHQATIGTLVHHMAWSDAHIRHKLCMILTEPGQNADKRVGQVQPCRSWLLREVPRYLAEQSNTSLTLPGFCGLKTG